MFFLICSSGADFLGPLLPAVADMLSDFDPMGDVEPSLLKLFHNLLFYIAKFCLAPPVVKSPILLKPNSTTLSNGGNTSAIALQVVGGPYMWNPEWSSAVQRISQGTPPVGLRFATAFFLIEDPLYSKSKRYAAQISTDLAFCQSSSLRFTKGILFLLKEEIDEGDEKYGGVKEMGADLVQLQWWICLFCREVMWRDKEIMVAGVYMIRVRDLLSCETAQKEDCRFGGKLSKLQNEEAQDETNIQEPRSFGVESLRMLTTYSTKK
ncbi:hypothetical protein Tco_0304659 [Tanacetum coccineum]